MVAELESWARRAEADLGLLEALCNRPLGPGESLAFALPKAVLNIHRGATILARYGHDAMTIGHQRVWVTLISLVL